MSNLNLIENTSREQALLIYSLIEDERAVKIKKTKSAEVIRHIWDLASNRDDSTTKKMLKLRASELNLDLVG